MSRITAPDAKLARGMNAAVAATAAARATNPLLDNSAHYAGAMLMPKYAELLHNRRSNELPDSARSLATAHRPTPQPSLANRSKPLMQTFHSTAPAASSRTASNLDAAVIPSMRDLTAFSTPAAGPRVPLLPDNFHTAHGAPSPDFPAMTTSKIAILAANPENVIPGAPLSEVNSIGPDSVELKFVHEEQHHGYGNQQPGQTSGGMIRDLWKGMVEDVLGPAKGAV